VASGCDAKVQQAMRVPNTHCERCGGTLLTGSSDLRRSDSQDLVDGISSHEPVVNPSASRGGEVVRCPTSQASNGELPASLALVLDDLAAARWVQSYDAAWLGQDWGQLERRLAPDVEFVVQRFTTAIVGRRAVMENLREVMRYAQMHEYNATDLRGHSSGPVGIITYRWQLDWTIRHERTETKGRDVLVLRAAGDDWQLLWRAQFRA
jgi:hypothetical protein